MRTRALPWIVASLALHAAVVSLVRVPAFAVHEPNSATAHPFTLELELHETQPREPLPTPMEPAPASEPKHGRAPVRGVARQAESRPSAEATSPPAPSGELPSPVAPPAPNAANAKGTNVSPRAAALSIMADELREVEPAPSAEQVLNDAIRNGAVRKRDVIPDPVLEPRPEGGYAYRGHGFDAVIDADGQVHLQDRYGHISIIPKFQIGKDGSGQLVLLHGNFHLFEWLDRKFGKNDPHQSERRWFLERTRDLRERLGREYSPKRNSAAP